MGWPITIYGTGKQVRDILYATDVCEAFDSFYRARKPGIYNIGGGISTAISLLECIDVLEEINGIKPEVKFVPGRHGDLRYFICDSTKAKRELRWSPQVKPKNGIKMLIDWIKGNKGLFTKREK